jgi:hypothetical protein
VTHTFDLIVPLRNLDVEDVTAEGWVVAQARALASERDIDVVGEPTVTTIDEPNAWGDRCLHVHWEWD